MIRPFDRLPQEPPTAFVAFCYYRDMVGPRSIDRAYRDYQRDRGKEIAANAGANGSFAAWCAQFRWVDRAAAWDDHLGKIRTAAAEAAAADQAKTWQVRAAATQEDEYKLGVSLTAAAARKATAAANDATIELGGLAATAETAIMLRRRACGLPLDPAAAELARKLTEIELALEAGDALADMASDEYQPPQSPN